MANQPDVSVIIITRNRPQLVRDCLKHLDLQTVAPDEIIVVDSSTGEDTQMVLDGYPEIVRLRIPDGRNNMPQARNLGIGHARGEVIAFLDDDSMAQPDWLRCLLEPYADPAVGGVGGRVIDALEQARAMPEDPRIGVVQCDGKMTTNFILDPGQPVEVDHVRGCNMSFRRAALEHIGGFDPRYIGSNVCEETDVCLSIKRAGWKLVYHPAAVVNHLSAPREGYRRERWLTAPSTVLYTGHNRSYLFFKNFGINYDTLKHNLGGMQLLHMSLWRRAPSWETWRAIFVYALGAWWGLSDSLLRKLRRSYGLNDSPTVQNRGDAR